METKNIQPHKKNYFEQRAEAYVDDMCEELSGLIETPEEFRLTCLFARECHKLIKDVLGQM